MMSIISNFKNHPLFTDFTEEELEFISDHSEIKQFSEGETIMFQGSYNNKLYLLEKGTILIYVTLPGDIQKLATKLQSGQIFGEVSFLTETPVTASIIAENNCTCLCLSREVLNTLHFAYPQTGYKFEINIIHQTREKIIKQVLSLSSLLEKIAKHADISSQHARYLLNKKAEYKELLMTNLDFNHLKKITFFSPLNDEQIHFLLSFMSFYQYDRGYPLQSSQNSQLRIPYSGGVMMFIKKNKILSKSIAVLGTGELFLENPEFHPYFAFITSEKSLILELDCVSYQKIRNLDPTIFFHITRAINYYIAHLVYVVNRQFVRINCEYDDLLTHPVQSGKKKGSGGDLCAEY